MGRLIPRVDWKASEFEQGARIETFIHVMTGAAIDRDVFENGEIVARPPCECRQRGCMEIYRGSPSQCENVRFDQVWKLIANHEICFDVGRKFGLTDDLDPPL